ncbi:MAG: MarR family transcriptional regulator [Proteobacteria bacterium]|nr:MarR family transcriptional regulator [Pseudomonadota bacterium]
MLRDEARTVARIPSAADFYCAADYRPDESVGYLMKRIMMSVVSQVDIRLEAHGLTSAQWGPLLRIKGAGRCTVAELARWLQVDAGAMTRLLDRLEKKGLCKRVRCTEDRRVVRVELTPEGEAAIVDVPAVLCDVMNGHLAGFSKTEWLALRSYLQRMLANGEALREAA